MSEALLTGKIPTAESTAREIAILRYGLLPYGKGLLTQRAIHQDVVDGIAENTLLLLEHPPVFTAGRRTTMAERPTDGTPVIDVDRGGKITFHGPGQLVGYPIIKLRNRNDVVGYVRELERAIINICADFGITTQCYGGKSGVWIRDSHGDRKISAIGIRVAKGVTMHGFALNVNPDLSWFEKIIPCGIPDAQVTSMEKELGRDITTDEVIASAEKHLRDSLRKVSQ